MSETQPFCEFLQACDVPAPNFDPVSPIATPAADPAPIATGEPLDTRPASIRDMPDPGPSEWGARTLADREVVEAAERGEEDPFAHSFDQVETPLASPHAAGDVGVDSGTLLLVLLFAGLLGFFVTRLADFVTHKDRLRQFMGTGLLLVPLLGLGAFVGFMMSAPGSVLLALLLPLLGFLGWLAIRGLSQTLIEAEGA